VILLFGLPEDSPLRLVAQALERAGAPHLLLNHADVLELELDYECVPQPRGTLVFRERTVRVEELRAIYLRPYDFRAFPHLADAAPGGPERRHAERFDGALWGLAECSAGLVLNRPSAMQSNGSKPYQSELIRAQGFDVPETLVTNDPAAARDFWREHGDVVYKSISGRRSVVGRLGPEDEKRLAAVAWCPVQLQRRVPGVDHRVHVVGDDVFTCRVDTEAVDYRYGAANYAADRVPPDVGARCVELSRALGLPLVGIDLRRTPEGRWVCFEANPSPAFSCYEHSTGQPISAAVAALLMRGGSRSAVPATGRTSGRNVNNASACP
jgi:glutathione synthase/RimK-type ligase-like ATP-grasp enzyme